MDFIHNGKATGTVAQRLLANGMNPNVLRTYIGDDGHSYMTMMVNGKPKAVLAANATLRKDEWKHMDQAILPAARQRLVGIADLYSRGLVYRLGNGLGKTVLEYESLSELTPAEMTMDGVNRSQKDRPNYELNYLPLPITHKDFHFNARVLAASRTTGDPLDTTTGEQAGRQVAEFLEGMLFNGTGSYSYGGGTIYGYTDHPQRNEVTLTATWDTSGVDGEDILDDVRAMKQASIDAKHYGPWVLYIPTAYETILDNDFKSASDKSIRQRIMEINGIQDIKVVDKLAADNVLLVQTTSDVVRVVEGMPIQTIEWQTEGGMVHNFKVMAIIVPQIRADQHGNSGIVHLHGQ